MLDAPGMPRNSKRLSGLLSTGVGLGVQLYTKPLARAAPGTDLWWVEEGAEVEVEWRTGDWWPGLRKKNELFAYRV